MSKLTKSEKYLFSLTQSEATTTAAQRAAIKREGLTGLTPSTVRAARQKHYRLWLTTLKPNDRKLPSWLLAARYQESHDGWIGVATIKVGRPCSVSSIARLAHDSIDWGRQRKHSIGNATASHPRVRTITSGTGWDMVTNRYTDYLCVLSPDGRKIAVQVKASMPVEIHTVYGDRFFFGGELHSTVRPKLRQNYQVTTRDTYRALQRAGANVKLVRQTSEMVASGSGEDTRIKSHNLVCVVADGIGGYYHVRAGQSSLDVRIQILKRQNEHRLTVRNAQLDERLSAAPVWVCIEDSLSAGNCAQGTTAFVDQIAASMSVEPQDLGAVRSDIILATRDNRYTRGACRAAALRRGRVAVEQLV